MQFVNHIYRCILVGLLLLCSTLLPAEVNVKLRSGQTIVGDILFEDSDVIVVKDSDGKRYQYPRQEVMEVSQHTQETTAETKVEKRTKKVGVILQVNGGGATLPATQEDSKALWGGQAGGRLLIGACNVMNKQLFVGGGVGYDAYIMPTKIYSFIPIVLTAQLPLMPTRHAPALGLSMGYGISLSTKDKGGFYTALDAGWRYQLNERNALFLGVSASIQQAYIDTTEKIEQTLYTYHTNRCFCSVGLKLALQF